MSDANDDAENADDDGEGADESSEESDGCWVGWVVDEIAIAQDPNQQNVQAIV